MKIRELREILSKVDEDKTVMVFSACSTHPTKYRPLLPADLDLDGDVGLIIDAEWLPDPKQYPEIGGGDER